MSKGASREPQEMRIDFCGLAAGRAYIFVLLHGKAIRLALSRPLNI